MAMPQATCYKFCPIGAIVCTLCGYPIPFTQNDYVKALGRHETQSKHVIKSSVADRRDIVRKFELYIDQLSDKIVAASNEDAARSILQQELVGPSNFPFCNHEKCKKLVFNKRLHCSKKHVSFCNTEAIGFASKFWVNLQPKVLAENFAVTESTADNFAETESTNFCHQLLKALGSKHSKHGSSFIDDILKEQRQKFNNDESSIVLNVVDPTKNPNVWVMRACWDEFLNGYNAVDIFDATLPFENRSMFDLIENKFAKAITDSISDLRKISRSHQIFTEIERRSGMPYPTKPFQLPSNESCKRYLNEYRIITRIILRLYDTNYGVQEEANATNNYPKVFFSDRQKIAVQKLIADATNIKNCLEYIISLLDQEYNESPFECILICALAFMSLRKNLTYRDVQESSVLFSGIQAINKIVLLKASNCDIATCSRYALDILSHPQDEKRPLQDIPQRPKSMSWIINTFSYAKAIARTTTREGLVIWDQDTLLIKHIRVSMVEFKMAVLAKVDETSRQLLILTGKDDVKFLPTIPWESTYDSFNNHNIGYSFLTDEKNPIYHLTESQFNKRRIKGHMFNEHGAVNELAMKVFKEARNRFLSNLLCLIHITAGQPARGSELIRVRVRVRVRVRG